MQRRKRKAPARPSKIEFEIEHLDPLGQGVSKKTGIITFIAGTLPGESGTALVYKRAKGVQFARLQELKQSADNRIEPLCPHFNQCPGCQYLHIDYDSELSYKGQALARHLGKLGVAESSIEVVPAPRRLAYRNRVQLHYRHKYIGLLDAVANEVLPVPDCKIIRSELQPAFDQLYQTDWTDAHAGHGHCELYFKSGETSLRWNEEYSQGGFSQVYDEMNLQLQNLVQKLIEESAPDALLDLFSGDGNLSETYANSGGERVMIDNYSVSTGKEMAGNFHQMDLYAEATLPNFMRKTAGRTFNAILIDPPRKGFPDLDRWVKKIKPDHVVYVSCNPASLAWDLQKLSSRFRIKSVQLLDLFPSTSHFETLVMLEMRKAQR